MEGKMNLCSISGLKRVREFVKNPRLCLMAKKTVCTLSLALFVAAPGGEDLGGGCATKGKLKSSPAQSSLESKPSRPAPVQAGTATDEGRASRSLGPEPSPPPQPQAAVEPKPLKDLPKVAVWDLAARNAPTTHAQELTSILVSEITQIRRYEVYSQENVRTLAGWTEERMKLGCTSTQCLTALGQMDISKLVSGSVGKIGDTYTISLNLFDTQNAKAENAVSEFCRSENELIHSMQAAVKKLLALEARPAKTEERTPAKYTEPPPVQRPTTIPNRQKPLLK
jgi:hypothetical protein